MALRLLFPVPIFSRDHFCNFADVCRARAAAATDDLCTGGSPLRGPDSLCRWIAGPGPTTVLSIPSFAGVGVDDDGFVGRGA